MVSNRSSQTYLDASPYIESETFMSYAECEYAIVPELPPALKKFAATSWPAHSLISTILTKASKYKKDKEVKDD